MKRSILLTGLSTVALLAAGNGQQYSYQHGKDTYQNAKGTQGQQHQHRYQHQNSDNAGQGQQKRLGDGSGGGQQHRYGKGGGRGGKR